MHSTKSKRLFSFGSNSRSRFPNNLIASPSGGCDFFLLSGYVIGTSQVEEGTQPSLCLKHNDDADEEVVDDTHQTMSMQSP